MALLSTGAPCKFGPEVEKERQDHEEEDSDHYPMESIPQGQCLIVNVAHFLQHDDRLGSDIDAVKLHKLFEDVLNFVVTRVDDPTLLELEQTLIKFSKMNHSDYDAFFIIILSHGDPGGVIYTSDSQSIKISEISDYLTASICPTLANKPKVFIIQACRGTKENKPVTISLPEIPNEYTSHTNSEVMQLCATFHGQLSHGHTLSHDGGGPSSDVTNQTIPDKKDFYYAFATIDDHEALRHRTDGSWFIYEFVIAVKKFAHKYGHVNLQELMLKVNEQLSKHSYEDRMQACEVKHSITKKIVLSINTKGSYSLPSSAASSLTSSEDTVCHGLFLSSSRSRPSSVSELVVGTSVTPPLSPKSSHNKPSTGRSSFNSGILQRKKSTPSAEKAVIVPSVSGANLRHQYCEPHPLSRSSVVLSSNKAIKPGYRIVINIHSSLDDRLMKTIRGVFSDQLGFHVQVYSNLTRKGIKHLLETVANVDHSDLSYLVVIVLGTAIPKKLELSDIVRPFESLTNIPKLFLIEIKLNEKGYNSFYNDLIPVNIPLSFINIVNVLVDIEETFLQCLLQTITVSSDKVVFQDVLIAFQKRKSSCKMDTINNLKDTLVLHKLGSLKNPTDQTPDEDLISDHNKHNNIEMMLATRLLSLIRDATINKLTEKRNNILHICKSSGARQLARKLYEATPRGKSGAESKVISKAKLERTQAALEVDRQLIQQVNELIGESHTRRATTSLILPPELSEIISMCTKTSEMEAADEFYKHLDSLQDQHSIIEDLMQFYEKRELEIK